MIAQNADARLIAALAAGMTREDAAEAAGVSASIVVYRRLREPEFQQALRNARAEFFDQAMR